MIDYTTRVAACLSVEISRLLQPAAVRRFITCPYCDVSLLETHYDDQVEHLDAYHPEHRPKGQR